MSLVLYNMHKGDDIMAMSKAHIKATARYNKDNYKTFTVNAKIAEYEKIVTYCNNKGISKAQLLLKSAIYVIDNDISV